MAAEMFVQSRVADARLANEFANILNTEIVYWSRLAFALAGNALHGIGIPNCIHARKVNEPLVPSPFQCPIRLFSPITTQGVEITLSLEYK